MASGNVYVADSSNARIQKFDSNGNFLAKWGSYGSGDRQFLTPVGVGTDSSGNVYVTDPYNYRIQKFDSSGRFLAKWGSEGGGNGQFRYPEGVATDPFGNIYVSDAGNNARIQKFDSSGKFLAKWGGFGSGDGQFNTPTGVATDRLGKVYVADHNYPGNYRIQKFGYDMAAPNDTTAPTVSQVSPENGATGVSRQTNVTATFSEAMDPATLTTSTVTLAKVGFRGSTTPVTASVRVSSDGKTVTLDPSTNLGASANYRATIKGGSSGAKDSAGNPLAADKVWSFKTGFK